jgi:phosphate transport system protein
MLPSQAPHTLKDYDVELDKAKSLVLEMGARVERQAHDAVECLHTGSAALIEQVLRHEVQVNELERSIDELASQIIARRQPAAGDLRLLTAVLKTTTDLERIGDEAKKIALLARKMRTDGGPRVPRRTEVRVMAKIALDMLHRTVDGFERLDLEGASEVMRRDADVNEAFRSVLRQLVTYMIEDPRTITASLDLVLVAKSLERIGDHAKNIAEYIVYVVKGTDVRHVTVAKAEHEVRS